MEIIEKCREAKSSEVNVKSEVKSLKSKVKWKVIQYKVQQSEIKWSEVDEAKWSGMRWSEVQYREWWGGGTSLYGKGL